MILEFESTRGKGRAVDLETALFAGMAPDGGLYLPREIPRLAAGIVEQIEGELVFETAVRVLGPFLESSFEEIVFRDLMRKALDFPIPLVRLRPGISVLELFHGPTLAFKDVAARSMARWMGHFRGDSEEPLTVLVATSGDTGGAVADAFADVPGARVVVLYPRGQVSELQEAQMTTLGDRVTAVAVDGTFDDCQRLVKQSFADRELRERSHLTSANSINIGRLLPQIVYYFHAVAQLPQGSAPPIFCTPSGNFGNLTAGLMARRMGLPVSGFIAATNANDVVPQYLGTGEYRPRPSRRTISNAMDVGDPSNLERIQALYDHDLPALLRDLEASSWSDDATREAIRRTHGEYGVVLDPHTAVGLLALEERLSSEPGGTEGIVLATAHPAKFRDLVEPLIGGSVDLPDRLARCLERKKRMHSMASDFGELRGLLRGVT